MRKTGNFYNALRTAILGLAILDGALIYLAGASVYAAQPVVYQPKAHAEFCERHRSSCIVHIGATGTLRELSAVNSKVNRSIQPDNVMYARQVMLGRDDPWAVWPKSGLCHDYAVTKQAELLRRGWPSSALLLAIVLTPEGEGHLILLAKVGSHALVLDNVTDEIMLAADTPYYFWRVQDPRDPRNWRRAGSLTILSE